MYVTDTHALVYHIDKKFSRLGKKARRIFQDAEDGRVLIYIPSVVLWEIVGRLEDGDITFYMPFDRWCRELHRTNGFSIAALEWQDVHEARAFQFRDPFDRLIAGTAARLGMPLISKDSEICESGTVETIW